MLNGKSLLDYTNIFSPSEYEKNEIIILKYFQQILERWLRIKSFAFKLISIENLKTLKHQIFSVNH